MPIEHQPLQFWNSTFVFLFLVSNPSLRRVLTSHVAPQFLIAWRPFQDDSFLSIRKLGTRHFVTIFFFRLEALPILRGKHKIRWRHNPILVPGDDQSVPFFRFVETFSCSTHVGHRLGPQLSQALITSYEINPNAFQFSRYAKPFEAPSIYTRKTKMRICMIWTEFRPSFDIMVIFENWIFVVCTSMS